jgi:hypothetical protein|nr:MAG TPA: Homing endonuclease repeat [Caudoviricetes sp.]
MKIILALIIAFLLFRLIVLKLTLAAVKRYMNKIGRYPTSEDIDICTKELIKEKLGKS